MILHSWSFSVGRVCVHPFEFLQSDSLWDADTLHRQVLELELQGYAVRRETYRVTPEMNPETGQIVHLHTVELYQSG